MMINWRAVPELNSSRDSSCCDGFFSSVMFSKIPHRVICQGRDRSSSGSANSPEYMSDNSTTSTAGFCFDLRKITTVMMTTKDETNEIYRMVIFDHTQRRKKIFLSSKHDGIATLTAGFTSLYLSTFSHRDVRYILSAKNQ